jgi:hypothetical protein
MYAKGEWVNGQFYPYKSQADMGSTEAELAARQQQATSRQPGVDEMATKSDRELLELAAKAAGIEHDEYSGCVSVDYYDSHDGQPGLKLSDGVWNPLIDDGDAFRLAVKLRMDVRVGTQNHTATVGWGASIGLVEEVFDSDEYAATRRAVTRAAAEIGKAMVAADTKQLDNLQDHV